MPRTKKGTGYYNTETSEAAADDIDKGRGEVLRGRVLGLLKKTMRPMASDAIAVELDEDLYSIRPRLTELRDAGLVEDSGKRGVTRRGKACILWQAKQRQGSLDL